MDLSEYRRKRDFSITSEPAGGKKPRTGALYLIQKHDASHLHYDFRLELDGVLLSWAVPKGPSLDPHVKRLAMQTEDHPVEYGSFEGTIPKGQYGGGTVMLWDTGWWEPHGDPHTMMKKGHLSFELHGEKLHGSWHLVRTRGKDDRPQWLLFKSNDDAAAKNEDQKLTATLSVKTGRTMSQIEHGDSPVWRSNRAEPKASTRPKTLTKTGKKTKTAKKTETEKKTKSRAKKNTKKKSGAKSPPRTIAPELALLTDAPPKGDAWAHEAKLDGYRILARVDGDDVTLLTRKGNDWTMRMPWLVEEVRALGVDGAIFDGELVAMNAEGRSDFQLLQNALSEGARASLAYYAFDLLFLDGVGLRDEPLIDRKNKLEKLLAKKRKSSRIFYSSHTVGHGDEVFAQACKLGLEGIVSKKLDSAYEARRGPDWLKVKCTARQELVIGGFTEPRGSRSSLGALLVGARDSKKGHLRYAGKVGTGFSEKSLASLRESLAALETDEPPFENPPHGYEAKGVHWVKPTLVAEIELTEMTRDGKLRHPTFRGLRDDKGAEEVVVERAHLVEKSHSKQTVQTKSPRLTNPDRVLYPENGITKEELATYYEKVASRMLPHVEGRPLTLVRCPNGRHSCFFQKHASHEVDESIREIRLPEKQGSAKYMTIHDEAGLLALVQLGVLEIHTWGCHDDEPEKPDWLVFDLDPDTSLPWKEVTRAAFEVRERLAALELDSVVKTTGGKGLHVCVPVARRLDWDTTKEMCRALAEQMVHDSPDRYVATVSKAKRAGKILVDYLRNGRGATFVAPYSTRAREGAPVAMPLRWSDLRTSKRPELDLRGVLEAKLGADPWKGVARRRQSTVRAEKALLARSSKG